MPLSTIFQTICHFYFNYHYNNSSSKPTPSAFFRRVQFAIRMTISFLVGGFLAYGTPLNNQLTTQYLIPVMCILSIQETCGMTLLASYQILTAVTPLSIFLFVVQKIGLGYKNYLAAELVLLISSLFVAYKCSQVQTRKIALLINAIFFSTIVNQTNLPSTFIFILLEEFVIGIFVGLIVSIVIFPLFATFDVENRVNYCLTNLQQMETIVIQAFLCTDQMSAQVSLARASTIEQMVRTTMNLMHTRLNEARMEPSRCLQRIFNRRRRHLIDLTLQEQEYLVSALMFHICSLRIMVTQCQFNEYHSHFTRELQTSLLHLSSCQSTVVSSLMLSPIVTRDEFNDSLTKLQQALDSLRTAFIEARLQCSFELFNSENFHQILFHRPIHLDLSILFTNGTSLIIPRTHVSLYDCERMALNCTSCLQLDPSFSCIWCNNMCMFKNQTTITNKLICPNSQECLSPIIETIEPLLLPMNGGTLVTIKGNHFDLFNLSIYLADIPCHLIEEESSNNKIVCQSGDAGTIPRTGFVLLKFGLNGPQISSRQIISYINPTINMIEPLIGIESGGTLLTIQGENLTLGNSHISISISNRPCQLLSLSRIKIQCETTLFSPLMLNQQQPIKLVFDRQTKISAEKFFTIVPNPILYSFDKYHQFQSFMSGGHQLIIDGDNFDTIQNIRLEFKRIIFVSSLFHNRTHLVFLTPSIQELHLNNEHDYQHEIEIIIHLDHFNKTSSLIYMNDPLIYELEPMLQTYTNELIIRGFKVVL
ncbi:unnamed protein product [Rotaria sp. Silwood2]|nr:unnamed protein product [Rotaria sp. Silwood2]